MESLVECVPNFSEASEQDTLDAIASAVEGQPGTWLLDRSADVDHQRSVFTLAGYPGHLIGALERAVEVAIERIDMRSHVGRHPRIGAVDVVPFIPIGDSTLEQCADGARRFAAEIAERFELPVYLYGAAAIRADRRVLADVRRDGYEGLETTMRRSGLEPDFGPVRPHPTAGATAVGARGFLIAFNIQLSTTDVAVARRIATRIRERDGGLPAVQALGIELATQGSVQLSMNILDHERTALWKVWDEVGRLAQQERVSMLDSELIGLAPAMALLDVADHIGVASGRPIEERLAEAASWLRIRMFDPSMVLELRLAQAQAGH